MKKPSPTAGNRIIKFRCWDLTEKMMQQPLMVKFKNGEWIAPPDSIVMQSTGLLDKNGVLIYEGDILGYGNAKCEIGWDGNLAKFTIIKWIYGHGSRQIKFISQKFEIIGNIWENPELLS